MCQIQITYNYGVHWECCRKFAKRAVSKIFPRAYLAMWKMKECGFPHLSRMSWDHTTPSMLNYLSINFSFAQISIFFSSTTRTRTDASSIDQSGVAFQTHSEFATHVQVCNLQFGFESLSYLKLCLFVLSDLSYGVLLSAKIWFKHCRCREDCWTIWATKIAIRN